MALTREERMERNRVAAAKLYRERRELVDRIKLDAGCTDCGFAEHPAALVFDHRDPMKKSFRIAGSLNRKLESLLAEIAKCDVRCANCHAIKTFADGDIVKGRPRPGYTPKGHYLDPVVRDR